VQKYVLLKAFFECRDRHCKFVGLVINPANAKHWNLA